MELLIACMIGSAALIVFAYVMEVKRTKSMRDKRRSGGGRTADKIDREPGDPD